MPSAGSTAASVELRGDADSSAVHAQRLGPVDYTAAAWLCAVPCALITILAIALLGPPLGSLLSPDPGAYTPLADTLGSFRPEPTERARYLLALCGPLLYIALLATSPRWLSRVPARVTAIAVPVSQALLAGALVVFMVAQYTTVYDPLYSRADPPTTRSVDYFTPLTLLIAAALAAALVAAIRRPDVRQRITALLRESRTRRIAATIAAVALTAVWMLHAVHSDRSIGMASGDVLFHIGFTLDEVFAVLNGRTPLVDFTAQYGSLVPYVAALPMLAFGKSLLAYTIVMSTLTGIALLAIFGVLRRVTRSAIAAFLLYLPFLATSLFIIQGSLANRSTPGTYFGTFPTRYLGPYLLAWLTARHLDRNGRLGSLWLLFAAAGVVFLNNAEFGITAIGASVAALVWGAGELSRPLLRRIAVGLVVGLMTGFALVSVLTLARAGSLPQLDRLLDYVGLFSVGGFGMLPIAATLGLHLIFYVTYVAALVAATVRALRHAPNRVLTGMLAWSGIFGLGSATYFVGRSDPDTLKWVFSPWALAVVLLTIVVIRELAASPSRRPAIASLAVLVGFGITACSVVQVPLPWTQIERLEAAFVPTTFAPEPNPLVPPSDPETRRFVSSLASGRSRFVVKRGAPVAILMTNGHRVADAYGVVNVSPYTGIRSVLTVERVNTVLDALQAAGGNTVVLPNPVLVSILNVLRRRGFELVTDSGLRPWIPGQTRPQNWPWPDGGDVMKWVDVRHLHPRALE